MKMNSSQGNDYKTSSIKDIE